MKKVFFNIVIKKTHEILFFYFDLFFSGIYFFGFKEISCVFFKR